jgi:hypothetical protein
LNTVFEFGLTVPPSFMCNMESKENTDENVKKGKFLFFFAQKSQASTSSFSFSRPEKVVTLFFSSSSASSSRSLNYT